MGTETLEAVEFVIGKCCSILSCASVIIVNIIKARAIQCTSTTRSYFTLTYLLQVNLCPIGAKHVIACTPSTDKWYKVAMIDYRTYAS